MKLLLVESGASVGGTERVVWELATRLPPSRFEVRVWLSTAPGVDELAGALAARGLAVERIGDIRSRWDVSGMARTWSKLRRVRPDLVHLHHVQPAADRYLASLVMSAGLPHLVVTEHAVGVSHSGAQRALKRTELQRADAVTAVCGAVADGLVRDYGVPRAHLRVVPNGADLPDEDAEWPRAREIRERFGITPLKPLWVCAARLEEQKGHAVLLEALAALEHRGKAFVCAMAGEGSLRESLERRVSASGLASRVHFMGQVEDIGPLLLAADAVVMPSLWEGLPLTLLEALVRGRPVVASRVGGIPEVIEDGANGRLVPPGDVAALTMALDEFHARPDAAFRLGRAGARVVREHYTWPRVIEQFEAVYDDVLGLASFSAGAATASARGALR